MLLSNPFRPSPAPPAFGKGNTLPEETASMFSKLIFHWLSPFLEVGFTRPLEKEDLWELPRSELTDVTTNRVEANFFARCPPEKRPRFFQNATNGANPSPTMTYSSEFNPAVTETAHLLPKSPRAQSRWSLFKKGTGKETKYDESLFKALHQTFAWRIYYAGFMKLGSDTLQTTTPLVSKVILIWLSDSYNYAHLSPSEKASHPAPKGIKYGIGLAIALFVMRQCGNLMANQYLQTGMTTGLSVRTGLVGSVFRKSLRLSGRARLDHSVGQITTMISADATRLDRFLTSGHTLWVAPIQIVIGVALLLGILGYSALVGLAVMLLAFPAQMVLVKVMFTQRKKGVKFTDKRVRLTTEVLQGIRLLKFYAWEDFYVHQIGNLRKKEIKTLTISATASSLLLALLIFIPTLATILSFITYSLSGHDLNVAIIFTSLQIFNSIRAPLFFFPLVLSNSSHAFIALTRISKFLSAEELNEPYKIEYDNRSAINVDADFAWESTFGNGSTDTNSPTKPAKNGKATQNTNTVLPITVRDTVALPDVLAKDEDKPFELRNLKLKVAKGSLVGIVGRIGSGKSSILQGLIGEMRRTKGEVVMGGSVAYVPQTSWIQNATLRENILFGQNYDQERFRGAIHACSLGDDIEILPHREETEIGEKGINLSGGQKARVSLARAVYSQADIVLLDDPLSAVDAYVGKNILERCILNGPLATRTRVLVTHALHFLDKMDYIYVMENGAIIEQGTYKDLLSNSVVFSRLIEDYGRLNNEEAIQAGDKLQDLKSQGSARAELEETKLKKPNAGLMELEERNTGSVTWTVYRKYLGFAGGATWAPFIFLLLVLMQGAQVATNLALGFWTTNSIHGFKQGHYMALYAGLGVAQAVFQFLIALSFAIGGLVASLRLSKAALSGILRSPISFVDTTPIGRISSRLSKDQDALDSELSTNFMLFTTSLSNVLGTIALIFYVFPYLGIIFAPMAVMYYLVSVYYRRTSVETKRLDSLMRSSLYASYSESLTGLSTIRAYKDQDRSVKIAETALDMENRAYYMTISIQRWLGVRLDMFGNIVVLGIALFGAGFRNTVDPAKTGVVLSYTLFMTMFLSDLVTMFAQAEQSMNAVERVLHYTELPSEGAAKTPNDPPTSWPSEGKVTFTDVKLAYRKGLPLVLKGISFSVKPGEKVGIVGRTGAGKSSLLQALFRMVEVEHGTIEIDQVNIRNIGLDTLRSHLALVPQDTTLFLGTLRENLDPQRLRTDAELLAILQRCWLLPQPGVTDSAAEAKFSLSSTVGDEGSNYSAGEKQLLSLCRALVKNSRVVVLDEATSSVDVETDAKLQEVIQTELATSTVLCIAHRLNTIAYYDRIIVMDAGKIAEFDTVLNLFDKSSSIFRSLCDEANLSRADINKIRVEHTGIST